MKKILSAVLAVVVIWAGAFIVEYLKFHSFEDGDVSNVKIIPMESEIYSNEEINSAINVILEHLKKTIMDVHYWKLNI